MCVACMGMHCMAADWAAVGGQREMDRIGGKEQLTSQLMKTSPIYNLCHVESTYPINFHVA